MKHLSVTNPLGDYSESIEQLSHNLGKDKTRRAVFDFLYGRGRKPKLFEEICEAIGGTSAQVVRNALVKLEHGGLIHAELIPQTVGRPLKGYSKVDFVNANRDKIRKYADQPELLKTIPTKRRPAGTTVADTTVSIQFPGNLVQVKHLTVDDIDSFDAVRSVQPISKSLAGMTEDSFKKGIQSIIGEKGTFKDWGGEKSDLMTTRLLLDGKRVRAAFAFKGPGKSGKLTISKMGKNGDQGPRLFEESADLYVVQHWNEIDPEVLKLVEALAIAKSVTGSKLVRFCLIDGQDSERLVRAYPTAFGKVG